MTTLPRVTDIVILNRTGPWKTKSNGELSVLLGLTQDKLSGFFKYDNDELTKVKKDIRGLRLYNVKNLKNGSVGANEWHKIRTEIVFVMQGSVEWQCEDVYGAITIVNLDTTNGILVPANILHKYTALADDTSLLVIANTLFDPKDTQTHDTYPNTQFHKLQKTIMNEQ